MVSLQAQAPSVPTEQALLPCPFCGTVEGLYPSFMGVPLRLVAIDCVGCGIDFTPRDGMNVVESWNRRAPLTTPKP